MNEPVRSDESWSYTRKALGFAKGAGLHEQRQDGEYYQGRKIIARDTPINKGVYFMNEFEAVVVDDEDDPAILAVFKDILKKLGEEQRAGRDYKSKALDIVYETVVQLMPYDHGDTRAKAINQKVGDLQKVQLGAFIGKGVCRHQALLIGYLLEKLVSVGLLNGKVSVDRNITKEGGHAWARYTTASGDRHILDAAQGYKGLIEKAGKKRWPYARPGENVDKRPLKPPNRPTDWLVYKLRGLFVK